MGNRVERGALGICGGGIAGLNALFVASRCLSKTDRVILIERRPRVGGMWNDTYSYVRLHQPHPFFTAGDIPWILDKPRDYLATRDEVLDHLEHCLAVLRERVELVELVGHECASHVETDDGVQLTCRPVGGGEPVTVKVDRLIKAYGISVPTNEPLELSSDRVRSVSPDHFDLLGDEMRASDTPIYVIGGGKTGMDTADTALRELPGRDVTLIAGSGTVFSRRDLVFPTGARRWFGGTTTLSVMSDLAWRYDGTNEEEVHARLHELYGLSLDSAARNYRFGLLSDHERERVAAGVKQVLLDHLEDVTDDGDRPIMRLRSGASLPIEPGSWVINCTGYLFREESAYEPFLSDGGAVLSINTRSATHFLSTFGSYLMAQVFLRGLASELPLYELDVVELEKKSKMALPFAGISLALHNAAHIIDALPNKALRAFGVDLDRWYPIHRQLLNTLRFLWGRKKIIEHTRAALDVVRERFDVRCGPLN